MGCEELVEYVFGSGGEGGERIGFGLYQFCGDRGSVGRVSVFWLRLCVWAVSRVLGPGSGGVVLCLDSLCRWQLQISVYCSLWIPAHLRFTQCSILLYLMDICNMYWFIADITNPDSFV